MAMSTKEFWRLAIQSKLLNADQGKVLAKKFASVRGASDVDDAKVLAEWLVSENAISRYQSKVLLAGRAGPFQYGDYQVYDRITDGRLTGMFRAVHTPTRHPVLLAFLSGADAKDARRWATIASQAQTWARTSHPNLMRVFEPVDVTTHKFLVLEDLRGQSLEELLQAGPRTHQEAAAWAQQVAMALSHLHRAKMVHGDVRPATIWIGPDGQVKLVVDPRQPATAPAVNQPDTTGQLLERADYFAPEFVSGRKLPDAKTDIYALGCTFYQTLSGRPPFAGGDVTQKLQRHASEAVQPLDPSIPSAIGQLVNYMMAKNVDVRYQEADPVVEQLRPFVQTAPPTPATPETLAPYVQYVKQKQAELAAANAAPVVSDHPDAIDGVVPTDLGGAAPATSSLARRPKKKDKTAWIVGGVCAAAAAILAIVVIAGNQGRQTADNDDPDNAGSNPVTQVSDNPGGDTTPANPKNIDTKDNPAGGGNTAKQTPESPAPLPPDDGESLWASPTSGDTIKLDFVPPSGLAYITCRPASLMSHDNGARVLSALGDRFQSWQESWEKRAGVKFSEVDSLLVGFHENGDAFPRPSFVVRLATPRPKADLVAAWSATEVPVEGSVGYFKS